MLLQGGVGAPATAVTPGPSGTTPVVGAVGAVAGAAPGTPGVAQKGVATVMASQQLLQMQLMQRQAALALQQQAQQRGGPAAMQMAWIHQQALLQQAQLQAAPGTQVSLNNVTYESYLIARKNVPHGRCAAISI